MPSEEDDFCLALKLQLQFDKEQGMEKATDKRGVNGTEKKPAGTAVVRHSSRRDLSIVDPYWELHDPTPDVRQLFVDFNETFFWGKLGCVQVSWSKQMTSCAGICSYKGGLCSIRLSQPLLLLRPRKDLVETLLHEMIHALLFVTHNNKDRTGHGPEFHKHMKRINEASGAKITVYHDFHDEVESYRIHKWRCDGPCQTRRPYFGYVRRAVNRAPAPRDLWWAEHQSSCGGTFHKVAGPAPGIGKRKGAPLASARATKSGKMDSGADIRAMFGAQNNGKGPATSAPASRNQGGPNVQATGISNSTLNLPGPTARLPANVHTLSLPKPQTARVVPFTGTSHTLGGNTSRSRLVQSGDSPSSSRGTSASSSISGTTSVQQGSSPPAARNDWIRTGARPKSPKPSCSMQKTLTDFVGQKPAPAKPVSRANGAAKMKFIVELLNSDSESDDECTVLPAGGALGTTEQRSGGSATVLPAGDALGTTEQRSGGSASLSQPSSSHAPVLVHCPVCECFIEELHINAHLDVCLARDN